MNKDDKYFKFYRNVGIIIHEFIQIKKGFKGTGIYDSLLNKHNIKNANYLKNRLKQLFEAFSYLIPLEDKNFISNTMAEILAENDFMLKSETVEKYDNILFLYYLQGQAADIHFKN